MEATAYSANEPLIFARLYQFLDPKPADLTEGSDQASALKERTLRLQQLLGGPDLQALVPNKPTKTRYDTYMAAALEESILMFNRARSAVWRSHMHCLAVSVIEKTPEGLTWPSDPAIAIFMKSYPLEIFWEHAETAYIKLASFWDRLGLLLDFVFFNIRQFDREGFPAVMDKIRNNFLPMHDELRHSASWDRLRSFQTSEKIDGLKWLLRRRNLLIHSLHLRPWDGDKIPDDPIFESAFNHLEESAKKNLAPGTRHQELSNLHSHLKMAAGHFHDVLALCELGAGLKLR